MVSVKDLEEIPAETWRDVPLLDVKMMRGDLAYFPSAYNTSESFYDVVRVVQDVSKNYVDEGGKFVDLGCGDGLVCLVANNLGLESFGIELNPKLVQKAREYNQRTGLNVQFLEQDWTRLESFRELGVRVGEIDVFYIYPSCGGLSQAFRLVCEQGKDGAFVVVKGSAEDNITKKPDMLTRVKQYDDAFSYTRLFQKIINHKHLCDGRSS